MNAPTKFSPTFILVESLQPSPLLSLYRCRLSYRPPIPRETGKVPTPRTGSVGTSLRVVGVIRVRPSLDLHVELGSSTLMRFHSFQAPCAMLELFLSSLGATHTDILVGPSSHQSATAEFLNTLSSQNILPRASFIYRIQM